MPGWSAFKNYLLLGETEDWTTFTVAYPYDVTDASVTAKIISSLTGSVIVTLLDAVNVSFSAGVNQSLADMGATPWLPVAAAKHAVLRLQISGGTPAVATFDEVFALPVLDFPDVANVLAPDTADGVEGTADGVEGTAVGPSRPSWSADPTAGDGQVTLHLTAASPTDVLYPVWRSGSGEFTAPSESFKRTGSGDVTVTGLTNGDHVAFLAVAKNASGLYSLPTLKEAYATPQASGAVAAAGQLSLPVHYLRQTLAASAAWQALVGAADAEEALDSILPVCGQLARAHATIVAGAVTAVTVDVPGFGYRSAPTVTIVSRSGAGSGATATATVSGGEVTVIEVTEGGEGYADGDCEVVIDFVPLPVAIVGWMPDWARRAVAGGSRNYFEGGGPLFLLFRLAVDADHTEEEAAYTALNALGAVIDDLEELAGTAGHLDLSEIRQALGPARTDEDEAGAAVGDHYMVGYAVHWNGP